MEKYNTNLQRTTFLPDIAFTRPHPLIFLMHPLHSCHSSLLWLYPDASAVFTMSQVAKTCSAYIVPLLIIFRIYVTTFVPWVIMFLITLCNYHCLDLLDACIMKENQKCSAGELINSPQECRSFVNAAISYPGRVTNTSPLSCCY